MTAEEENMYAKPDHLGDTTAYIVGPEVPELPLRWRNVLLELRYCLA